MLLLALLWGGAATRRPPAPLKAASITRTAPRQAGPVAVLIRALLDTAGGVRAADARLGLAAGTDVRAFYGADGAPAWTRPTDSLTTSATAALALLARAAEHGLRPADYGAVRLRALRDSLTQPTGPAPRAGQRARLDVYLSDAVLRFMRDLGRGRLHRYVPSGRERAAGAAGQPAVVLRAALGLAPGSASGLGSAQELALKGGGTGSRVTAAMLAGQPANREYRQLQQALAHWLARPVALAPDSVARRRELSERAAVNLERWRWEAFPADSDYVLVNIPAFELLVVAAGTVRRRHRVIVGKPGTTTPTLSSTIRYFTLAPGWHVPHSIATKEILPHIKRDAGYLARHNYEVYDRRGRPLDPTRINWAKVTASNFPYTIRQSAGCDNALGNIVFRFANPYSVYVHDTPLRQLFARPGRALSHGCIRLEQPMALAGYLLRREGSPARLPTDDECARSPRSRDVRLARPIALYVRYATCTAENGRLRLWPDIYGRDAVIRRGLFGAGA